MDVIQAKAVSYTYQSKYQKVEALKDVSVSFEKGRFYAITGESGSGKSTFLSLLAGLDLPTQGEIFIEGRNMRDLNRDDYRKKQASVVYQAYHLLPLLTALENVMLPMEINGVPKGQAKHKARDLLLNVGIEEAWHQNYPKMLSGGQQQRVAIARAMAAGGKIILADEPTGNLDSENEEKIVALLKQLTRDGEYLVIVVTHNSFVAKQADVICRMKDGILEA